MEEKLSALEALGALKGLIPKQWHEHKTKQQSMSAQCKDGNTDIKPNSVLLNDVINIENSDTMLNSIISEWNSPTQNGIDKEKEKQFLVKSCTEMETNKSDIFKNFKSSINTDCDKDKGKTEISKTKCKEITRKSTTQNSVDEASEESESNEIEQGNHEDIPENIPAGLQEWVENLKGRESKDVKVDNQGEESFLASAKLSREASLQSSSSLDSILDARRPDPVEIFLNLGFGGLPGVDMENCRIPKRFLVPSKCKGGDWNEFLRRELLQAQNFECSSLGFRGLSGPSYRRPSAIVANIMEKLRERTVPQAHSKTRFSTVAKRVLNEKSVLNKLTSEFQSVLSPDSRKFLQNQGKKSPEVPRRRIIFGQKSFAFAHDGEFVEVESSSVEGDATKDTSPTLALSDEDSSTFPNSEVLLKLRRTSLQKQKKIDEDNDVDDVFYIVDNEERSSETESSFNGNECAKKAGKIPRRFLSSSNLKALEESNQSEAMRLEVEKEILNMSQKIKSVSNQDLPSILQQVKELRSKIEKSGLEAPEM